jgi:Putative esterase
VFEIGSLATEITGFSLAIASFALTIIFWKKLGRAKWNLVIGRISILIMVQVLFLGSIGIAINRSGEFFSSWNDLFGNVTDLTKVAIQPNLLAQLSTKDLTQAQHTSGGSLIFKKTIKGAESGISNTVYVVLPPKIAELLKANPQTPNIGTDYQIVELFSGYPGVPETWIGSMGGIKTLEKLESSGQIKSTIAIIPTINVYPQHDTECLNFVGGFQVETWLTNDMKTFAQRFLGIDDRPWATLGYSTGGWCATEVAVRHQNQYSSAVSLAGYFKPLFANGVNRNEKAFLTNEYDLVRILNSAPTNLKILIIAGKNDRFAWASAQKFMASLSPSVLVKLIPIPEGGHNTKTWIPFENSAFQWINQN